MCDRERNDQSQKRIAHCHVNHSSNTVPVFSCAPQSASATIDEVQSDARQVDASECAYDKITMLYNITTLSVIKENNDKQLTCTIKYTADRNSPVVYSEQQFLIFRHSIKPQSNNDSLEKGIASNKKSGKHITHYII